MINAKKLTKKEQARNKSLMEDIIKYLYEHDLFEDVCIYTNGHLFSCDKKDGAIPCSIAQYTYYDHGEWDVQSQIEYNNPNTVTMTFEGPLYEAYNRYIPYAHAEDDIQQIADKYGLYAEQDYAWSLAFYE